jgi:hypothetical protein
MFPTAFSRYAIVLSLIGLLQVNHAALAAPKTLTVEAGEHERLNCVVSFPWKIGDADNFVLKSSDGRSFPVQIESGTASFLLDSLPKGKSLKLKIETAKAAPKSNALATKAGTAIELQSQGKTVLNYQMADTDVPRPEIKPVYRHNSYLYPILTPSGKSVTGDYPPDHLWHRGIWLAWTHTEFGDSKPDFWNQSKGDKLTARIDFEHLDGLWSGPVQAGFKSRHKFLDLGNPVLNETWEVRTYALPSSSKLHVIDLVSVQSCATDKPLRLPQYYYGGLGYRANRQWEEKGNAFFLISNGETDRIKMNEQRINWIHISGKTDGELAGIALMDHPDNFASPQPIRVNPKNPQTCFAPSQLGDWSIEPGKPLTLRYRFIVADGAPDKEQLDRLWQDFAHPPKVTW